MAMSIEKDKGFNSFFELKADLLDKEVPIETIITKYNLQELGFSKIFCSLAVQKNNSLVHITIDEYYYLLNVRKPEYNLCIKKLKREIREKEKNNILKEQSENLITSFLISGETKVDFLKTSEYTSHYFDECMEFLKTSNPGLFKKASKQLSDNSTKRYHSIFSNVLKLCENIKTNLDYNLFFYYTDLKILNLTEELFVDFLPKVEERDKSAFISAKKFLKQTKNLKKFITLKEIFSTKVTIHNKLVTDDEKQKALEFLKNNNIPQTRGTYDFSLKKVLAEANEV